MTASSCLSSLEITEIKVPPQPSLSQYKQSRICSPWRFPAPSPSQHTPVSLPCLALLAPCPGWAARGWGLPHQRSRALTIHPGQRSPLSQWHSFVDSCPGCGRTSSSPLQGISSLTAPRKPLSAQCLPMAPEQTDQHPPEPGQPAASTHPRSHRAPGPWRRTT